MRATIGVADTQIVRLHLWLKLRFPSGVDTKTKKIGAHSLKSIMKYPIEIFFSSRSTGCFAATSMKFFDYAFKFFSTSSGEFGMDNGVDGRLNIVRSRRCMKSDLSRSKSVEAIEAVGNGFAFGFFGGLFHPF